MMMVQAREGLVNLSSIRDDWAKYRKSHPQARIYDVAQGLGRSELELVLAGCGLGKVTRLAPDMPGILSAMSGLGTMMALTRNPHAVIEKHGEYDKLLFSGKMGLNLNAGLDLRLFLSAWSHVFAVEFEKPQGVMRSIQFFDAAGCALHKAFLLDEGRIGEYDALVARFAMVGTDDVLTVHPVSRGEPDPDDEAIDMDRLRRDWAALQDTHDFIKLLKSQRLGREQALRLAGEGFARPVETRVVKAAFHAARDAGCPVMVFIGNHGIIEIHTGRVKQLNDLGNWFNVLDPGFNLHLREDRLATAWVVRKPTVDGIVTSLEFFAAGGELIGQLFGERKPGNPELGLWREVLMAATGLH